MTKEQIENYEYCKRYRTKLNEWTEKLPFTFQHHGCSSQSPRIEHELERIHREMYEAVTIAMKTAMEQVELKVKSI